MNLKQQKNLHRSPITGRMIHLPPQSTSAPAPVQESKPESKRAEPPTATTTFNNCTFNPNLNNGFNHNQIPRPSHPASSHHHHHDHGHGHRQLGPLPHPQHQQAEIFTHDEIHPRLHSSANPGTANGAIAAYNLNHNHNNNNNQIHHPHPHPYPHTHNNNNNQIHHPRPHPHTHTHPSQHSSKPQTGPEPEPEHSKFKPKKRVHFTESVSIREKQRQQDDDKKKKKKREDHHASK